MGIFPQIYQLRLLLNRLKQTFFKLKFVINNRKLVRFKDTFFICSKISEYHHIMVPYYSYLIHHNFFCGFPCFDVKPAFSAVKLSYLQLALAVLCASSSRS